MTLPIAWRLAGAVAAVLSLSCGPTTPAESSSGQLPPSSSAGTDPWADALSGLTIMDKAIRVLGPRTEDREAATAKWREAEVCLRERNQRPRAAALFRDAIRLDPSFALPYEGLARCMMAEGRTEWVEAALLTCLRIDPNHHRARFGLGANYQMSGRNSAAAAAWKDLAARKPDYPEVYVRLAVLAYYEGNFGEAGRYLQEAEQYGQVVPPQIRQLIREASVP